MNDAITIGGYLLWRLALGADPSPEGRACQPPSSPKKRNEAAQPPPDRLAKAMGPERPRCPTTTEPRRLGQLPQPRAVGLATGDLQRAGISATPRPGKPEMVVRESTLKITHLSESF